MWQNSDLLQLLRRSNVISAIVKRFPVHSLDSVGGGGRDVAEEENGGSTTWVEMNLSGVESVDSGEKVSPFPLLECLRHRKDVREKEMVWKNLNSVTPRHRNRPWKPSVIANCLLQNPLRIDLHSLEKMLQSFRGRRVGEDRICVAEVVWGHQWCYWMRSQQTEGSTTNIN